MAQGVLIVLITSLLLTGALGEDEIIPDNEPIVKPESKIIGTPTPEEEGDTLYGVPFDTSKVIGGSDDYDYDSLPQMTDADYEGVEELGEDEDEDSDGKDVEKPDPNKPCEGPMCSWGCCPIKGWICCKTDRFCAETKKDCPKSEQHDHDEL